MGDIHLDIPGAVTSFWPPYMTQHLEDVVRDWALRVENGNWKTFMLNGKPITEEHLRIAKVFLERDEAQPVVTRDVPTPPPIAD